MVGEEKEYDTAMSQFLRGRGINKDAVPAFCSRLKDKFLKNAHDRRVCEIEWMESLRQIKGIYDPLVASRFSPNTSRVYPKITAGKLNNVLSRLNDMLFPDLDRNYVLDTTPVPSVSKPLAFKIKKMLTTVDPQTGQVISPTKQQLEDAIERYCKEACKDMQKEMDDQLFEMRYEERAAKPALKSACRYGTGIIKGPLVDIKRRKTTWAQNNKTQSWDPKVVETPLPVFSFVSLWNWFPDMDVVEYDDAEGAFERHVMSAHGLRKLMGMNGFDRNTIATYLEEHQDGDYTPMEWENEMRTIKATMMSKNVFEAPEPSGSTLWASNKYEVLEYWGWVGVDDLIEIGVADESEKGKQNDLYCNIWLLGNVIIKAVVVDPIGGLDMYKLVYYDKDETSIFGYGFPQIMRHSQLSVASASRMMLNNGAICVGPQLECNIDLLMASNQDDIDDIYPMKIWLREGRGIDAQYPVLRSINIDSHILEYLQIIDLFRGFADEETCLPAWMITDQAASGNETASGRSMKMSSVTAFLKDIVKHFDDLTEKVMSSLYAWNMEFSDNDDIKGDYQVKPRGATSLVTKEVLMQAINQFIATLSPEDWAYIDRREMLEQRVKANDLPLTLKTEEEADAVRQAAVDAEAIQLAKDQARADIGKTKAMELSFLTKAKEKNRQAEDQSGEAVRKIQDAARAEGDKLRSEREKIKELKLKTDSMKKNNGKT